MKKHDEELIERAAAYLESQHMPAAAYKLRHSFPSKTTAEERVGREWPPAKTEEPK